MTDLKEAEIKYTIGEYLQYGENQLKWWYERLNCGNAFKEFGGDKYRIKLCREGTSDFIVVSPRGVFFIEVKTEKGKQSDAQIEFQAKVEAQHPGSRASYHIVRSLEEVEGLLE